MAPIFALNEKKKKIERLIPYTNICIQEFIKNIILTYTVEELRKIFMIRETVILGMIIFRQISIFFPEF